MVGMLTEGEFPLKYEINEYQVVERESTAKV